MPRCWDHCRRGRGNRRVTILRVNTTLDMRRSFETMAVCPLAAIDRTMINKSVVAACQIEGEGLFSNPCADGSDGEESIFPSSSTISSARCAAASFRSILGSGRPRDPALCGRGSC